MFKTIGKVTAAAVFVGVAGAATAQTVSISTLPPGSINYVQTQAIARVIQEETGLEMRIVTFNSPAASMQAVEVGEAEFSFMSNDEVGAAVRGTGIFEDQQLDSLRLVTRVFPFKVGIVTAADSGIESVEDLRGKRFPVGWQGFPQGISLSLAVLATAGLDFDDVDGVPTVNLLRGADDVASGRLDATIFAIGAPRMAELDASLDGIRFIDLPDSEEAREAMAAVRPEYTIASQEPAPHLHGVLGTTNLMEYAMTVVAGADVDDETVQAVARAIHENKDALVAGHPSFNAMEIENLAMQQPGVEYHPAAVSYYQEAGLWPADAD